MKRCCEEGESYEVATCIDGLSPVGMRGECWGMVRQHEQWGEGLYLYGWQLSIGVLLCWGGEFWRGYLCIL